MADLVSREEVLNIVKDMHDLCRKDVLIQSIEDIKALETVDLVEELKKIKSEIELMDFDLGDYYDHTDTIIAMVSKVVDKRIEELLKGE